MVRTVAFGVLLTLLLSAEALAAQLTVSWVDNSGGVAGFRLERRASTSSTYAMVASLPAGVTSWIDLSVLSGTSYCYRVRAVTTTSASAYSNESCKTPGTAFTVAKAGTGTGTVVSSPSGINCGTACSANFSAGSLVTLTATPSSGSTFSGWTGGGCSGTAACLLATNLSTTVTATFTKIVASSATLTLTYNGKLRDRVGFGNVSRAPDGTLDGTFTVRLQATGGRTVTRLMLEAVAPNAWDTDAVTSARLLGVASTVDGALLNNATSMAVNFFVADRGSFALFAADAGDFVPGRVIRVTARFSDGTTATALTRIPGLAMTWNGKLRDRVGSGNTARAADGRLDGVATVRLYAPGGRTITRVALQSSSGGQWDTNGATSFWLLGVASSLDGALLNSSTSMAVNFAVADGGAFVIFASDSAVATHFTSGRIVTVTATLPDGSTWTASTRVP